MKSRRQDGSDAVANAVSNQVIGAALEVHRLLGPGLLESAYAACLARELRVRGIPHQREVAVPVNFKGERVECGYRLDFLVGDGLVVEVKAVESLHPLHTAQLLTCLRLTGLHVGLLFTFHVQSLKQGIRRVVNNF